MNFILIQGPFNKRVWAHYKAVSNFTVVASCWNSCNTQDCDGNIVKSEPPNEPGIFNINYQKKSVISGVDFINNKWKDNDNKILKIRSDFIIPDPDLIFSEIKDTNTIYTTSCFSSRYKNYFTDYILAGNSYSIIKFFSCDTDNSTFTFPERLLYSEWDGNIALLDTGRNSNIQYWIKHQVYVGYRELNLYEPSGFRTKSLFRIVRFIMNKIYRRISC